MKFFLIIFEDYQLNNHKKFNIKLHNKFYLNI